MVATNTLDADASHLAAPESVTSAAQGGGGELPPILVTELAPGNYHFGGREASGGFQYNMVLVEFETIPSSSSRAVMHSRFRQSRRRESWSLTNR